MVKNSNYIALGILLFFSLWMRVPTISDGMPYFEREDEAHHFNRTVRMVQSGDFNPHYFHKPSLHFYLRMPFVAAGFLSSVRKGEIRKIQQIQTKDSYGIGGYAFSVSHPRIVKWNRSLSVALHLGTVAAVYFIGILTGLTSGFTFFCTLLFILSRTGLEHSTTIGVDVVVTFFAALTGLVSVIAARDRSIKMLALASLLAGLAISSKYNALPIIFVPLVTLLYFRGTFIQALLTVCFLILLGFFGGSPYILSEIPLFLNHFAYEIWHYGIAGHVGNQAEPGIQQAYFYLDWLLSDGFGPLGGILALLGFVAAFTKKGSYRVIVLAFPITFLLLMISQRANFTRNMLVALPYLALLPGYFLAALLETGTPLKRYIPPIFITGTLLTLIVSGLVYRSELVRKKDSREVFQEWATAHLNNQSDIGCSGELWLSPALIQQLQCRKFSADSENEQDLINLGFSTLIIPSDAAGKFLESGYFKTVESFSGVISRERIVRNPAITVLELDREKLAENISSPAHYRMKGASVSLLEIDGKQAPCEAGLHRDESEDHCWLNTRFSVLDLSDFRRATRLQFSSPWMGNRIVLTSPSGEVLRDFTRSQNESEFVFALTEYPQDELLVYVEKLGVPAIITGSKDSRLLGANFTAIR